jgi:hypothetical protein
MEDDDLEIGNYDLADIFNLFKCDYNFTEADLKNAKMQYLMTHPDKSNLPIKYFLFYKKAYKTLEEVFRFRKKKFQSAHNVAYNSELGDDNTRLLKSLHGMKINEFNDWFNKAFDKVKIHDDNNDTGYGQWLKSNEAIAEDKPVHLSQFGDAFNKKKNECRALVVKKDITEASNQSGSELIRDKCEIYSSDMFSKLNYEDVRKAHTESVVPVTHQDFLDKPKFNSVDSYIKHRDQQDTGPSSLNQAKEFLAKRDNHDNEYNSNRAFKILRQDEQIGRMNQKWWSNLKTLEN